MKMGKSENLKMNLLKKSEIDLQDGKFEALLVRNPENPIELQQTINA